MAGKHVWALAASVALGSLPLAGTAQAAPTSYVWSVDGSVDNSGLPAGFGPGIPLGPNVSSTKDGKRIEIGGEGDLVPSRRRITGGGKYRVLGPDGKVLASGRWLAKGVRRFRDTGTEPEGSPVQSLRAGVLVAPVYLEGLGSAVLDLECDQHAEGAEGSPADELTSEIEGVRVTVGRWRFDHIEQGSTTLERR